MIDGDKAIEYLKNKLINLIDQGIIKATYEESNGTISFYISDIVATNRPPLTLRLSNHHENFNNRKKSKSGLPQGDDNLSIELYKPNPNYENKVKKNVSLLYHTSPKPEVIPFSVTTIEYRPWLMCGNDVNLIYQSILNWIKSKKQGAVYIDPLANTSRRANIQTHQANITPRRYVTQAEKNFYLRYGLGDNIEPRYNIIKENKNSNRNMNKKLIRLTESDLHRIVRESVNKVLNETDLYDTLARPDGKLDLSNPYTWTKSPEMLKKMGYDENGMKRGKKYYDHLLNPNWKFNKDRRDDAFNFANDRPNGDQRFIRADIADMEKKQRDADARWEKAADSRPLHRNGSLNRA